MYFTLFIISMFNCLFTSYVRHQKLLSVNLSLKESHVCESLNERKPANKADREKPTRAHKYI